MSGIDDFLKQSLMAAWQQAQNSGGVNVYALLYAEREVKNIHSDTLLFIQEADSAESAQRMIEATLAKLVGTKTLVKIAGIEFGVGTRGRIVTHPPDEDEDDDLPVNKLGEKMPREMKDALDRD